MGGTWSVCPSSRTDDQLSKSSTEDIRTKFLTPEVVTAIAGTLSGHNMYIRWTAMDVIGKLVVHGQFDRQVVQTTSDINLQQNISGLNS
jgi:hypothetical protein